MYIVSSILINQLYIQQIHIRFNKSTGYKIGHKMIYKYKMHIQYQSIGHSDKESYT
jgi:hypothetical protein